MKWIDCDLDNHAVVIFDPVDETNSQSTQALMCWYQADVEATVDSCLRASSEYSHAVKNIVLIHYNSGEATGVLYHAFSNGEIIQELTGINLQAHALDFIIDENVRLKGKHSFLNRYLHTPELEYRILSHIGHYVVMYHLDGYLPLENFTPEQQAGARKLIRMYSGNFLDFNTVDRSALSKPSYLISNH